MQYSPKLKIAMEEIKAILNKHDIAGFVVLYTPGYSEYLHHLATTYSCASVEPTGIRMKLSQDILGKEKARQIGNDTYNMVHHINHHLCESIRFYDYFDKILKEKLNAFEVGGSSSSSHQEQNN